MSINEKFVENNDIVFTAEDHTYKSKSNPEIDFTSVTQFVKKFFSEGVFTGYAKKDFYGSKKLFFKKIGKFQTPSTKELRNNKRSRSAKLRIAEKI